LSRESDVESVAVAEGVPVAGLDVVEVDVVILIIVVVFGD
jgi:hypothetical protein